MNTIHRVVAATAAVLLAVTTPAVAGIEDPMPEPEPPAEVQWPPASTHGAFRVLPANAEPVTLPACDSQITFTLGEVDTLQYRALVNPEGDTVVEYRGDITVDVTRASDGAVLDEVALSGKGFEVHSADGTTVTADYPATSMFVAVEELEREAFAEAGLPEAFLFLSGRFTATLTWDPGNPGTPEDPVLVSAEITEYPTDYVFDLCDLLDQAVADTTTDP
jgi:hypothetical protein